MKRYAELYGDIKKPGIKSPGGNILDNIVTDLINGSLANRALSNASGLSSRLKDAPMSCVSVIANRSNKSTSFIEKEGELSPTFGVIQRKDTG